MSAPAVPPPSAPGSAPGAQWAPDDGRRNGSGENTSGDAPATTSDWHHHQLTEGGPVADTGTQGWSTRIAGVSGPALKRAIGPVTGLGLVVIGLIVVCTVVALLTSWEEFAVAAVALAVLLAVAALFLIGRSSYAVQVDLHSARVIAGQRATGALVVRNTGTRRLLSSRIELPVGGTLASFRIPGLAPGAEHEDLFVVPTSRRAVIPVGPATSVRGDALGLLRRQVRWTTVNELYVHPRTVTLYGAATGAVKDLEGQPTRDLSSNDVSFHALRQYVPGDDRRYVHWKSSAKTGRLMVRQFEETRRTHLAVALSIDPAEYESIAEFELAVSAAASLGAQAIREERPVTVCTGPTTLRATNGRRLLDGFAALDPAPGAGVLIGGRQAAAAVPNASVAVLVTGSLPDAALVRRASAAFSVGIRVVAVQIRAGAKPGMGAIGRLDVATVGSLDDLAAALRRMRAA